MALSCFWLSVLGLLAVFSLLGWVDTSRKHTKLYKELDVLERGKLTGATVSPWPMSRSEIISGRNVLRQDYLRTVDGLRIRVSETSAMVRFYRTIFFYFLIALGIMGTVHLAIAS